MSVGIAAHLGHSLQVVLGTVFLAAAVAKLRNPLRFVSALRSYELVPRILSRPLAAALMVIETLVGLSLLLGWALDVSVSTAGALLLSFAVAVGINLRRGRVVPCGCFGSMSERISPRTMARLCLLMLAAFGLAVVRLVSNPSPLSVMSIVTDGIRGLQRLVLAGAFGAFLTIIGTWVLHIRELRALLRRPSKET